VRQESGRGFAPVQQLQERLSVAAAAAARITEQTRCCRRREVMMRIRMMSAV